MRVPLVMRSNSSLVHDTMTQYEGSIIISGSNITLSNVVTTGTITIQNSSFVTIHNCASNASVEEKKVHSATTALTIIDSDHITITRSTFMTRHYRLIPDHIKITVPHRGIVNVDYINRLLKQPLYTEGYLEHIARGLPVDVKVVRSFNIEFKQCELGISNTLQPRLPCTIKIPIVFHDCSDIRITESQLLLSGLVGIFLKDNDGHRSLIDTTFHLAEGETAAVIIWRAWKRHRARIHRPIRVNHIKILNELRHKPPSNYFPGGSEYHTTKEHFKRICKSS